MIPGPSPRRPTAPAVLRRACTRPGGWYDSTDARARHRRHRPCRHGDLRAARAATAAAVVAAGRADGDLSPTRGARALVERAADELGGLDLLVHAASDGFEPRPFEDVREHRLGRGVRRDREGRVLRGAGGRAPPARVARHDRADRGRRRLPAWPLFAPALRGEGRRRRCSRACSHAPSRPRSASSGSRRARSRSSRSSATVAPPRRCSARVGAPDDVADAVVFLAHARTSSPGRRSSSTAARCCKPCRTQRCVKTRTSMELALAQPAMSKRRGATEAARRPRADRRAICSARIARRRPRRLRRAVPPLRADRCSGSRCAGSATATAPRRRCRRRSPRSGARRAATGRSAGPGAPWLYAVARNAIVDRFRGRGEPVAEVPDARRRTPGPTRPPRPTGSPGASTARSRSCRRTSGRCSSSRTGAGSPRARSPRFLDIPLGTVKTRTTERRSRGWRPRSKGRSCDERHELRRARGRRARAGERERLRRTHELLAGGGPPPELPPSLARRTRARRRPPRCVRSRAAIRAGASAAALVARGGGRARAFGAGYLVRRRPTRTPAFASRLRPADAGHGSGAPARARRSRSASSTRRATGRCDMTVREPPGAARTAAATSCSLTKDGRIAASCGTSSSAARDGGLPQRALPAARLRRLDRDARGLRADPARERRAGRRRGARRRPSGRRAVVRDERRVRDRHLLGEEPLAASA